MFEFLFETVDYGRRLRVRRLVICLLGLALVLVAGYLMAPPAYRHFKQWRARGLAADALYHLQRNDHALGQSKAKAAWLLAPGDPAVIRAMAQAQTRATNASALAFWSQLIQTGHATEADRLTFVEQALRAGAAGPAAQELQHLLAEAPQKPACLWLASQLFTLLQDRRQTIQYASQAAAADPTNRQYNLFLSSVQFDAADTVQRSVARSNLWTRAAEIDALALDALVFLAERRDLSADQRQKVITLLGKHPLHTTTHDLLALRLEIDATPLQRGKLLDQAATNFQKTAPEMRVQFGAWLNQLREFDRTLQALPAAEALKRKDYFMVHLDALAALNRWADLLKLLESSQTPLEAAYTWAFRARCHSKLNNQSLADLAWRDALRAAEGNPEQLQWLAIYAEKCDQPDTARKALRLLISRLENPRNVFRELTRLTERFGTTIELRDLLAEMVRRWPREPALQNDFAYLNLLLNTELAASCQTAETLSNQFPESLPFGTTFALALYRQKDFTGALRVYANRAIEWPRALPSQRAVYAAVLAANGHTDEARRLRQDLRLEQLRAEEDDLLAAIR